jgi:hypothetical protein
MMDQVARKVAVGIAAIVGAKYLDAKMDLYHDYSLIKAVVLAQIRFI